MTAPPRVRRPAGTREGGQFAPTACAAAYAALDVLAAAVEVALPPGQRLDPTNPARVLLDAPRCPHNSFTRWAVRNCCRPAAGADVLPLGAAGVCGQPTADGSRCTRRTTRADRHGRPACHQHGGSTAAA